MENTQLLKLRNQLLEKLKKYISESEKLGSEFKKILLDALKRYSLELEDFSLEFEITDDAGNVRKEKLELENFSLEAFEEYYVKLRKYEYESNKPLEGIEERKKIHRILLTLIKIDRITKFETLKVISDKRKKTDKPIIYACTHIGGNDIERMFEAIEDHAYLFLGDPKGLYKDFAGLMLDLNGAVCFETDNKYDRFIATNRAVEVVKKGANKLICPEGAWNITHNLPVMKIYKGTVKIAGLGDAEIVPMAIEQYGRHFYVTFGENIDVSLYPDLNLEEKNEMLRDAMATQKWIIWEYKNKRVTKRRRITSEYIANFKQNIVDKCPYGFTIEDVEKTMYKDSKIATSEEVYEFIERLRKQLGNTTNTVVFDEEKDNECRERAKVLVKELRQKYGRE